MVRGLHINSLLQYIFLIEKIYKSLKKKSTDKNAVGIRRIGTLVKKKKIP